MQTCRSEKTIGLRSFRLMSADEDVPHRRLPPSPSGRKSHILAGSKRTGHSPVFGKDRPLARCRTGKTHVVVDAPQGSLARCEGGLVRRYAEPYRSAPYKAVRKLRINGQGPKTRDSSPFRHRQYRERMAAQGRKPLFAAFGCVGGALCSAAARRVSTGQHSRFGVYHEAADAAMGK